MVIVTTAQALAEAYAYAAQIADVSGDIVESITSSQDDTTVAEAYRLYVDAAAYARAAEIENVTAKTAVSAGALIAAQTAAANTYSSYQVALAKRAAQIQAGIYAMNAATAATNAMNAVTVDQARLAWQQAEEAVLDASGQVSIANTLVSMQFFADAIVSRGEAYLSYLQARIVDDSVNASIADASGTEAAAIYDLVNARNSYFIADAFAKDAAALALENPSIVSQNAAALAATKAVSALASYNSVIQYYESQVITDASDAIINAADAFTDASNMLLTDILGPSGAYQAYLDASANSVSAQQLAISLGTAVAIQAASVAAAATTQALNSYNSMIQFYEAKAAMEAANAIAEASNASLDAASMRLSDILGPSGAYQSYLDASANSLEAQQIANVLQTPSSIVAAIAATRAANTALESYNSMMQHYTDKVVRDASDAIIDASNSILDAFTMLLTDILGPSGAYASYLDASANAISAAEIANTLGTSISIEAAAVAARAANQALDSYNYMISYYENKATRDASDSLINASNAILDDLNTSIGVIQDASGAYHAYQNTSLNATTVQQIADTLGTPTTAEAAVQAVYAANQAFIAYKSILQKNSTTHVFNAAVSANTASTNASNVNLGIIADFANASAAYTDASNNALAAEKINTILGTVASATAAANARLAADQAFASYTTMKQFYETRITTNLFNAINAAQRALIDASNTTLNNFQDASGAYTNFLDASSNAVDVEDIAEVLGTPTAAAVAAQAAAAANQAYQAYLQAYNRAHGI
jgi:hypothetical protein